MAGLLRFDLFHGIDAVTEQRIEATLTRQVRAGADSVWHMGDAADHVTFIERGLVQVARHSITGGTSVIALFGPGDVIGLPAALEGTQYPADAIVVSPSAEFVRVSALEVRRAMETDLALAGGLQRALLAHNHAVMNKIAVASAGSVAARLATLFMHLADRFAVAGSGARLTLVPVMLTRASLAGFVDARVETVIRTLSTWRTTNILHTTDAGFEVDFAALTEISRAG